MYEIVCIRFDTGNRKFILDFEGEFTKKYTVNLTFYNLNLSLDKLVFNPNLLSFAGTN